MLHEGKGLQLRLLPITFEGSELLLKSKRRTLSDDRESLLNLRQSELPTKLQSAEKESLRRSKQKMLCAVPGWKQKFKHRESILRLL